MFFLQKPAEVQGRAEFSVGSVRVRLRAGVERSGSEKVERSAELEPERHRSEIVKVEFAFEASWFLKQKIALGKN